MVPESCKIALKEWAVTVEALGRGNQILLLRKGGIHEEGKEFSILHSKFLLYPTYEHQKSELLKDSYQNDLQQTLSKPACLDTITFGYWAYVAEGIELRDETLVSRLSPYHIWADDYARKRLHWKPRKPLSVMLLRVHRLMLPEHTAYLPQYGGCKSWVPLESEITLSRMTPVLSDDEFRSAVTRIKNVLE